jgi:hypothetical protein
MNRYQQILPLVSLAGLIGSALAASTLTSATADETNETVDRIVGTWECDGGPPPFKVIKNFEAGGTMMEIDNIAFQESPTIGRWKRLAPLKYLLVARQYTYDPDGTWVGTFHYTQPLTMDPSLETLSGTFHFELIDPAGNSISSGDGAVVCKRMSFSEP